MTEIESALREQEALVQGLQAALYTLADPSADGQLLERLAREQKKRGELRKQPEGAPAAPPPADPQAPPPTTSRARLLGPDTTELRVETELHMQPLPTSIYHLLDPETDPLLTVSVTNLARQPRRIRVTSFLEGVSAQAVKTVELKRKDEKAAFPMHPTLLPERARLVTEVQWATLHVIVDILGNTKEDATPEKQPFPVLCESHNTFPVLCLARTSSFNSVRNPQTGATVDLTRYYGAWVTPYAEAVQERIRHAASLNPARQMWGYQGRRDSVIPQVEALYRSLKATELTYINSVIDYGAAPGQFTQRTRLPREALAQKSANCIDGTVLMASLLEGASLNPAIVLVPGHAFLGWETWRGSGEWSYLETTMLGSAEFEAACASGQKQYQTHETLYPDAIKRHAVADLRRVGIFPME
jgi:hypothetical protein